MSAAASLPLSRWQRLSWPHPEWWSLCLCAAAWLAVLSRGGAAHGFHEHAAHATHTSALTHGPTAWVGEALWWLVMVVAMMFPMVLEPVRATATRSLWRRRHRAIAGFLAGYLAPWALFGVVASVAVSGLRGAGGLGASAVVLGFGAAALWQVTPAKRRALFACHKTRPIAPDGWRADRDCLRYGWMVGGACLVSCWALMLACALAGHSAPAMLGATAVGWAERNVGRPNRLLLCAIILTLALTHVATRGV